MMSGNSDIPAEILCQKLAQDDRACFKTIGKKSQAKSKPPVERVV